MYKRKLLQNCGALKAGEFVTVTAATNQPEYLARKLVFLSHHQKDVFPHQCSDALVSLDDGFIDPIPLR